MIVGNNDSKIYDLKGELTHEDIAFMGFSKQGAGAMEKALSINPNVILIQCEEEYDDAVEFAETVYIKMPGCCVIMLCDKLEGDIIEKAMLAGVRKVLQRPIDSKTLIENIKLAYSVERTRALNVNTSATNMQSRVITVFGTKGGIGKTTISVNLAVLLAQMGKKTERKRLNQQKDASQVESKQVVRYIDIHADLKDRVHQEVINVINKSSIVINNRDNVDEIRKVIDSIIDIEAVDVNRADRAKIAEDLLNEVVGYGPIEVLLQDPTVTEIMVNGPNRVYVEKQGKIQLSEVVFKDNEHVLNVIDRIVSSIGRHIDESSPMVDARLQDGSRVNAIIQPLSLSGPIITIRKFSKKPITADQLIEFGSLSSKMVFFLDACVKAKLNIIVSGGTGSGKTTLLNVLSSFIPDNERIITIEDAAELQLLQDHVITLESRPSNLEGKGQISIRDLVKNSLRMRPDRIIVGEVRSSETLDMLQAMNTGHDGSLTTIHANTPRDSLSRIETMILMTGMELPLKAIRDQVSSAIDIIVQQARLRDGSRKIINITEVNGMEGDTVVMQDIFT